MRKSFLLVSIIFSLSTSSYAADWYVKKGATGANSGTSWTNAWNEMDQISWGSISAGDTIWLAGGTYTTPLRPQANGTSTNRIYIRRVRTTDAVPTSAAGWSASYDAQVIINNEQGILFNTTNAGHFITIDGRIDSGIRSYTPAENWYGAALYFDKAINGVTVQYLDLAGPGGAERYPHPADCKTIQIRAAVDDLIVRNSRLHGCVDQIMVNGLVDGIFENNELYHNRTTTSFHSGMVAGRSCSGTVTFRNNVMRDYGGEGILLGASAGDTGCTWKLYNNIVTGMAGEAARFVEMQYIPSTIYVYSNTLVDLWTGFNHNPGATLGSGSQIWNNILYNCGGGFSSLYSSIRDYNALSVTNTETHGISNMPNSAFSNYAGRDYRIISTVGPNYPRDKGVSLSPEYGTDILGVSRPNGSAWDIGAYENTGLAFTQVPIPPQDLQVR